MRPGVGGPFGSTDPLAIRQLIDSAESGSSTGYPQLQNQPVARSSFWFRAITTVKSDRGDVLNWRSIDTGAP